jgi:hypothetical protein
MMFQKNRVSFMTRSNEYRMKLSGIDNWIPYLLKNSGLPGPRGNLELAQIAAEMGIKSQFEQFLSINAEENTPQVFLVFCGILGLGKLAALGDHGLLVRLRRYASDGRWRIREGVATALQFVGDKDMKFLLEEMQNWSQGSWYEKRAAAAALAEPRLLKEPAIVKKVLRIFDRITKEIETAGHPNEESFKVLRQSMGYCWSVAIAALPHVGKPALEKWLSSNNPDVRWILRENLKKNRLLKLDRLWVESCRVRL